jgi:glutamyl-tRNA synthetase
LGPKYDKHCLSLKDPLKRVEAGEEHVVRLNIPENATISFNDVIRGEITFSGKDIDDQVLIKADGYPTYHMAVVVDDHFMKITHVIRGEEWITSTPKHVFLYDAFGWERPIFAHTPLLRNPDGSKISKRKNQTHALASWYLKHGYLPEAVLNYLALMGWSHPKQKEIFDLDEYIKVFDLKDMKPVGPVFDLVKLEWMNGEYIRKLDPKLLAFKISNYIGEKHSEEIVERTIPLIQERIKKLSDYLPLCEFFFKPPTEYQLDLKSHRKLFKKIHDVLAKITEWKTEIIGEKLQLIAQEEKIRNVDFFMWVRVAITGKKISPPLNESMELLGKKESLQRLLRVAE